MKRWLFFLIIGYTLLGSPAKMSKAEIVCTVEKQPFGEPQVICVVEK